VALVVAIYLRFDMAPTNTYLSNTGLLLALALPLQLLLGSLQGLYFGRWSYGSFEEVASVFKSTAAVGVLLFGFNAPSRPVPLSVPVLAAVFALVLMAAARYAWRLIEERRKRPSDTTNRVVVFGAGEGGRQIVTSLLRDPSSRYLPVALIDDDPRKQHLRVRGVPVQGTREQLAEVAQSVDADTLLVAIPSGDATLVREVTEQASGVDLAVQVLPPVSELFDGPLSERDIRPPTMSDLLGRREIDTDLAAIAHYLAGKRVLVTGAGGSIGSELCRHVNRFGPAELVMLDRDESALHDVQLSITGRALLNDPSVVVCDIRDEDALNEVFATHRPEVVFHAAALKHLPLLEMYPAEALKTNVWGTLNVLDAATRHGVGRFVNISTDKAADATSVLGFTKRITERLTAGAHVVGDGVYLSVRFGNVLGSRGSVLTTFEEQIKAGGPVTVTHPEVMRYFMTVEEAAQLVIQAGAVGRGREVMVLDMGEPVRILDVAKRLIDLAEKPVEVVFTGLRPNEKLTENLFGQGEVDIRPHHPLISQVDVAPLSGGLVRAVSAAGESRSLVQQLLILSGADVTSIGFEDAPSALARLG
jgi:FlaA1/EpsC-like NDP-sugar epimerase